MSLCLYDIIKQRKEQLERFLEKALPNANMDLLHKLQQKSVEEFVTLFKIRIIPMSFDMNAVINQLFLEGNMQRKDVDAKDIDRFMKYLILFCELLKEV
jgi:hypothetical protein